MIPVKETVLIDYDVVNEKDEDYKILVLKEIDFIRKNISKIKKNAKLIYNQKAKNLNIGYLESTLDFKMLEEKSKEYTAN
jgi:protein AbiQ